jgi:D-3-phosphoglycerate dehydrogenase
MSAMKVAITDYTFPDLSIEKGILEPAAEVVGGQCKSLEALAPLVADADALITQFAPIDAKAIAAMQKARIIVRYGIGVDNVDLAAARERGIAVANVPDYCINEVADHTLAFILSATRQVVPNALHLRAGNWGLAGPLAGMQALADSCVGVVGLGRIGRAVCSRLAPFRCRILACDPMADDELARSIGAKLVALDDLLAAADIVTLHCPSTPQTRKLINAQSLARMKPTATLVNLGRGDLVDTAALVSALEAGRLAGAALDVCDPEPIPVDSPLRRLLNVVLSAHVASASPRAVRTLRESAARTALAAITGGIPANIVNGIVWPAKSI